MREYVKIPEDWGDRSPEKQDEWLDAVTDLIVSEQEADEQEAGEEPEP